jgi:hypothetical protein
LVQVTKKTRRKEKVFDYRKLRRERKPFPRNCIAGQIGRKLIFETADTIRSPKSTSVP